MIYYLGMRVILIILIGLFSLGLQAQPGEKRSAVASAGSSMPDRQKSEKKKPKKDHSGQDSPGIGNAGQLINAKKEAIIGNTKVATDLFRQYIDHYPDDPVGFYELAQLEADQKNMNEAIRLCR